jgi:hypothetical protein
MHERVWLRRRPKERSQARSRQAAVLPASFTSPFFHENSLDYKSTVWYNI